MIKEVKFKNFKALRHTALPLSQLTLMVGPNGSGKSTALQGLRYASLPVFDRAFSAGIVPSQEDRVAITYVWGGQLEHCSYTTYLSRRGRSGEYAHSIDGQPSPEQIESMKGELAGIRIYSFDAGAITARVELQPVMELTSDGEGLAGVLDRLRDDYPERFEDLNDELERWLSEFDRILFDTPGTGVRTVRLRLKEEQQPIAAEDVSQGTLLALAILTLAYLPDPPAIVCLEEPDRGIHPRLLRDVRDTMCRLAYPEQFGEKRKPVQVIATTHSPYMLDLFRDHPEEIVIAHKEEGNVVFEPLSDRPDLDEILADTHLGDAWYSGILGGVATDR